MDEPRRSDDAAAGRAARGFAHTIVCPECGHTYEHEGRLNSGFLQCPACAAQFFAPDTSVREDEVRDDAEPDEPQEDRESALKRQEDLHYLRIRQAVLTERRSLARTRTWYVVGAVGCLVAAEELLRLTYAYVFTQNLGWRLKPIGYVFAAVAALLGAVTFFRRVLAINRDLARPALEEPETQPDFSTLGDGSERWKSLGAMHERAPSSEWRS